MTKRILFVSIAFPPKGDPECIQAGRYFSHLSKQQSMVVDVVTSSIPTLFMPVDESLKEYAKVRGQQIEVPIYEWKYMNYIIRKLFPKLLSKPDSKMTFHWQWKAVVKKLKNPPDVIYSRSYPLSSAIMAEKLADHYRVPWVLHLSDPWSENVLSNYRSDQSDMEKQCFQKASAISFTSEGTAALYQEKYPMWAKKMTVFPNVSDLTTTSKRADSHRSSKKIRLVYTGGLANTRSAKSILLALSQLHCAKPSLSQKLEVVFDGDMERSNRTLFRQNGLPFVTHLGLLSADEASRLQLSADLLVVIDSQIQDSRKAVFFPSKLLDYASREIPILAITDKGSATYNFVISHGGRSFSHTETGDIADFLSDILGGELMLRAKPLENEYYAVNQVNRLVKIFDALS